LLTARRRQMMAARPASIAEAFSRNAERAPDRLCLSFEGEEWLYRRLRERVQTFAAALDAWGLQPGDRVALFLGNCPDLLAAYLGTHPAGGVIVPVNTQYRGGRSCGTSSATLGCVCVLPTESGALNSSACVEVSSIWRRSSRPVKSCKISWATLNLTSPGCRTPTTWR
jgi:acyl-CoA synthetase (AMP-forming)/AMP-acid ligase II